MKNYYKNKEMGKILINDDIYLKRLIDKIIFSLNNIEFEIIKRIKSVSFNKFFCNQKKYSELLGN